MIAERGMERIVGDICCTSAPHEYQSINVDGRNEEGARSQHTPDVREMLGRLHYQHGNQKSITISILMTPTVRFELEIRGNEAC